MPFVVDLPADWEGWVAGEGLTEGAPFLISPTYEFDVVLNGYFSQASMLGAAAKTREASVRLGAGADKSQALVRRWLLGVSLLAVVLLAPTIHRLGWRKLIAVDRPWLHVLRATIGALETAMFYFYAGTSPQRYEEVIAELNLHIGARRQVT